jgi:hypothetical protein
MFDEVVTRIRREHRERDRAKRRGVAVRVTAVAAALALVLVVAIAGSDPGDGDPPPLTVAMTAMRPGVEGEAVVHRDPASTWVEITTSGLDPGETYAAWLEETGTGERAPSARSWRSRATSTSACTRPSRSTVRDRSASARPAATS